MQDERPAVAEPALFQREAEPRSRTAFAVVGALVVGLLTGFAGGFVLGQRGMALPAPSAAADVPTPAAESFTEASIGAPAEPGVVPPPAVAAPEPDAPAPVAPRIAAPRTAAPRTASPSSPAIVQFASRPAGAQVFLDGVLVGKTPLVVSDVKAGTRRVRLELPGHRSWSTSVDVEAGARVRVGASLEK